MKTEREYWVELRPKLQAFKGFMSNGKKVYFDPNDYKRLPQTMKIFREKDRLGRNYWIPESIIVDFDNDVQKLNDDFHFQERYGTFRTHGSMNKKPEYYKENNYVIKSKLAQ